MLEFSPESLKCIINSLSFSLCEIPIGLDLSLNILKLRFELLFGLNSFHKHDIVVTIHLNELVIHVFERHIIVLLLLETFHIFLN